MLAFYVDWASQPVGIISILMLLGCASLVLSSAARRIAPGFFVFASASFWLLGTPGFSNTMIGKLEQIRHNPSHCKLPVKRPVVVLGGGLYSYKQASSAYELLARDTLARITRAATIGKADTRFYLLGGGSAGGRSLSELMGEVLLDQGYADHQLVVESRSQSTRENALALQTLLPLSQQRDITLVTSAMHVARAAAAFEKLDFRVCHVKADALYAPATFPTSIMPYVSGLMKSTYAMREIAASMVYRMRGYT